MEEQICLARVAEQAERFEDMVQFLEDSIKLKSGEDFTIEEKNLLSVGFKNLIGSQRSAIRTIGAIEQNPKYAKFNDALVVYKKKIEDDLKSKLGTEAGKKKDAEKREERSHQSYAQVQDPTVAKNTTAAVQIEGKSKWEIGKNMKEEKEEDQNEEKEPKEAPVAFIKQIEKEHDIKVSKEDKKAAFEQVDADGSGDIDKAEHEKLNKNKNIKEHTMVCSSVDIGYRFKVFMFQNICK